jgi:tetraacyldisaccharide 4'-kinase
MATMLLYIKCSLVNPVNNLEGRLQNIWSTKTGVTQLLRPLTWLFCLITFSRRWLYKLHILNSTRLSVPVIIIGNLTVGGSGKTPLVVHVVNRLKAAGYRPGIISRGYGGKARHWPQQVRADSDPTVVGDEPILIARRTQCPMAVGPDRVEAGKALLKYEDCDIVICDDGLQHYALKRDIEIVVIDGVRRFGNGYCLPAGPLREPVKRLDKVDFIVTNGSALQTEYSMQYIGKTLINLHDSKLKRNLEEFREQKIHAVAGIGNPEKFYNTLKNAKLIIETHFFSDHHAFKQEDMEFDDNDPILMTEKDAVKCQRFATDSMWYLPIEAKLSATFEMQLLNKIEARYGQKTT